MYLADFGDTGAAFIALPQIPPRNVSWFSESKWAHLSKVAFEKCVMRKLEKGASELMDEKIIMDFVGITKLNAKTTGK